MIYARYLKDGEERWGWIEGQKVGAVTGDPFGKHTRGGSVAELSEVALLAPCQPTKIIAVSNNFPGRAKEAGLEAPAVPQIFLKPPSAIIGPEQSIVLPPQSQQVEHEAELAVVIGQRARWVTPEDSLNYVLGFTCANDVTARDLETADRQLTRAKAFDTFCPLGPWIVTGLDPADLVIFCSVSGQVRQMTSTREMSFSIPQLVAFISSVMTLEPGDVILTGTPGGVGPLRAGDRIEIEIEGIGRLANAVKAAAV
ncbi:MAG: fumarylacetoacetate hydrolase family protein [Chloroflexi bacterium]|nr:fumarylacetoacetate hydrolase family protein [Chloroflexota bacterium]